MSNNQKQSCDPTSNLRTTCPHCRHVPLKGHSLPDCPYARIESLQSQLTAAHAAQRTAEAETAKALAAHAIDIRDRSLPVETTDDIVRDARRYRRLQILGCAVDDHHLKAGTVSRFTNLDTIVDADLNAHPSRGEDSPLEPTEPRMPLEHYRTENGKLRKAMADLMHKCPRCRAEAKEALSAMTRKVHHPRCELMQPHGHEPPKCTCPSEKATDAPYLPFARKCDRCKKLVPSRRPVTSDVFYCSIECAD